MLSDSQSSNNGGPKKNRYIIREGPCSMSHSRTFLIMLIILQVAIIILFGFFTAHTVQNYTGETAQVRSMANPYRLEFVLTNFLAVIGFGLLLINHRNGIRQALFSTLLVASINAMLSPLFQKFWYNVMLYNFKRITADNNWGDTLLMDSALNKYITATFMRISAFCTISFIVSLSAVSGRIGVISLLITIFLFNCGFNLSYYLNYRILENFYDISKIEVYDDLQGSRVFSFAAGFSYALLMVYRKVKPVPKHFLRSFRDNQQGNAGNQDSHRFEYQLFTAVLILLGVAISISMFYYILDPYYTFNPDKDLALLNIFITVSSGMLTSMAMSSIIRGTIDIQYVKFGALSSLIYLAILGTFIDYPFVAMIVGSVGSILTTIFIQIHARINLGRKISDPYGFVPGIFSSCIFSTAAVVPVVIRLYDRDNKTNDFNEGRHIAYTAVSLGVGFIFGLFASLPRICLSEQVVFSDFSFFSPTFGIQPAPRQQPKPKQDHAYSTAPVEDKTKSRVPFGIDMYAMYDDDAKSEQVTINTTQAVMIQF